MAPVSTSAKPSRAARSREAVIFPAPAGPSTATMKGRRPASGEARERSTGRATALLVREDAHGPELLVALPDQLLRGELPQLGEVAPQGLAQVVGGEGRVAVGAAGGLLDHLVDDAEAGQVPGGEAQRVGRLLG